MPERERKETVAKLDQKMVEHIIETIVDKGPGVKWDDIQGLSEVKQALFENIIYP
jgi:SpoVK/Ycf46/Vps4 family AAA+-type ATPase